MQGKMMRERRWNEYVLSLLVQGMPREVVNGVNLRGLIGHAIRLSEMGSENAYGVIERVWEWDQGLVRRVLGTIVDDGVRGNVFGRLGVVEEEEEEEKEEQGQAESLGRIDVGEKVEREVLDVIFLFLSSFNERNIGDVTGWVCGYFCSRNFVYLFE